MFLGLCTGLLKLTLFLAEHEDDKSAHESSSYIWSKPLDAKEEKSKEEEYEDYFTDLLQ